MNNRCPLIDKSEVCDTLVNEADVLGLIDIDPRKIMTTERYLEFYDSPKGEAFKDFCDDYKNLCDGADCERVKIRETCNGCVARDLGFCALKSYVREECKENLWVTKLFLDICEKAGNLKKSGLFPGVETENNESQLCEKCDYHWSMENNHCTPASLLNKESPDTPQDCLVCSEILKNHFIKEAARKGALNLTTLVVKADEQEVQL